MTKKEVVLDSEILVASGLSEQLLSLMTYFAEQFFETTSNQDALAEVRNRYELICGYVHAMHLATINLNKQLQTCLDVSSSPLEAYSPKEG